jgi:two-component system sensor histidine kinase BarA
MLNAWTQLSRLPRSARVGGLIAVLALALLWMALFNALETDRERQVAYTERQLSTLARLLAQHSSLGFDAAERLARLVATDFGEERVLPSPQFMKRFDVGGTHIVQLAIADRDGRVIFSNLGPSTVSVADREHFLVHARRLTEGTFVSVPVLGRVSKRWTVQVTRRIDSPSGEFMGVVVVSVDPYFYTQIYKGIDLGESGSVTTVGLDGVIRARTVGGAEIGTGNRIDDSPQWQAMRSSASGTLVARSSVDGQERFFAFERIPGFDLVVVVGKATTEAMAQYHRHRSKQLTLGLMLSGAIVVGLAFIAIGLVRQDRLLSDLQEERRRANSINELKSRFIAMVSHEIHTPLTGVLGFSELLVQADLDPELKDYASTLHESAIRLRDIVGQITEVQSAGEGQLPFKPNAVDVSELVRSLEQAHAPAARAKDLRLRVVVEPDLGTIHTDRRLLAKALGNVLDNAIRYTDGGEVRVHVARVGPELRIDIADTGEGIGEDVRRLMFDPFVQDVNLSRPEGGGLGLGLFHANILMRMIGGTLDLHESGRNGSTFRFTLPVEGPPDHRVA